MKKEFPFKKKKDVQTKAPKMRDMVKEKKSKREMQECNDYED